MSYIPPRKRHLKSGGSASGSSTPLSPMPIPDSLVRQFNRSLNFKTSFDKKKREKDKKIVYADAAISKWFPVGLAFDDSDDDHTLFVTLTRLEPFSSDSYQSNSREKPLTLVFNRDRVNECTEERRVFLENPWSFVAENVKQDLISALRSVQSEMEDAKSVITKPTLAARVGRILFRRGPSTPESIEQTSLPESTVRQLKRSFYTSVSPSYMEYIVNDGVQKMGLDFEEEKDVFHVKVADNLQPDSTISCKCTLVKNSKTLKMFKIELNQVRHLVADMSCLGRDLDLRLMLSTKRTKMVLSEGEIRCIEDLIGSAVLDPEVRGGLKWPLGKDSAGDRFTVVGVWHTVAKSFRNSSIRVRARYADRFDFRSSSGEVAREVVVKIPGIVSQLQKIDDEMLLEMLQRSLKLMWDVCLCSGSVS